MQNIELTPQMIAKDFDQAEAICFSRDPYPKKINNIQIYPWQEGISLLFGEIT